MVERRPATLEDRSADQGLSTFVFDFLNSTELEHLDGELFSKAVGDRLGHLDARSENRLKFRRVREIFRDKLSQSAFDMLPNFGSSTGFSAALRGSRPFGEATTALIVGYVLFGDVKNLVRITSSEWEKPNYGVALREEIRLSAASMTAGERNERTLHYVHKFGMPTTVESEFTRKEIAKKVGRYAYAWILEFGAQFLPPSRHGEKKKSRPPADLVARDLRMATYVRDKASRLRKANFTKRISKFILLEGFPGGKLTCGKKLLNSPLTLAALDCVVETFGEWHIRTTRSVILEARRLGIYVEWIPDDERVLNMSARQHNQFRCRLRGVIRIRENHKNELQLMSAIETSLEENVSEAA